MERVTPWLGRTSAQFKQHTATGLHGPGPLDELHPPLTERNAMIEAEACLQCGGPGQPAPCVSACPTGIDIPGFIRDIAQGVPVEAARKIFSANILGASCARVCPVQVLCQGQCVLHKEGRRAIQIGLLQRFATDHALEEGADILPVVQDRVRTQSIAVVGAGPAGLSCAAELARLGYPVTVYESREIAGGLITHGIAPYKQIIDPLPAEVDRIKRMGVTFCFNVSIGKEITIEQLRRSHHAIFLGVGMGEDMPARIPGEDLPGVFDSLPFAEALKFSFIEQLSIRSPIAVIGGGNTAIDVAREAVRMGATDVRMLYRRTQEQMPAYKHEIEEALAEGVKIIELVAPLEILGDGHVSGVRCSRMQLGKADASGRPRPEPVPGSEFIIEARTVIKAIGQRPRNEFFAAFGIKTQDGKVAVNEDFQTSDPTCFAGGDCLSGGSTVVAAVRDGKKAAHGIDRFLTGHPRPPAPALPPKHVQSDNGTMRHYQGDYALNTAPALCKGCDICVQGCPTDTLALDVQGHIVVKDVGTCVFCGICESRCPDFAIWTARGQSARALPNIEVPT